MKAHEITSNDRLDRVLVKLCDMIIDCDGRPHSMVGAAVVDPDGRTVLKLGTPVSQDPELWCHAERTAIDAYHEQYGELPEGCVIVTTLSPCSDKRMELRYDESCTDLLEQLGIQRVYCGYMDPSQDNSDHKFRLSVTSNSKLQELCKRIGDAVLDRDRDHLRKQGVTESVNDYLWHGSKSKHDILYPQQANDTGGKKESNKNAVYATPSARVAIAMGLTTPGSDTGMFPNDPQMVLFKGGIRKGQMVYLHKVPKDLFIKHNGREWYSKPGVKEVKPIEVVAVPVDKWLHLIRTATPKDLELQKKYMKKQGVTEDQTDASNVKHVVTFTTSISPAATKSTVVKHYGRTKTFATREAAVAWATKKNQIYRQENKPGRFEAATITDHRQSLAENIPQPGESSGAPKQFGPDAEIQTRQMTVKQIISSVPGLPYYNNVVDDWDAKDYSWGVTKKVIEYATYLKQHPESLSQLPPLIVLNGKFEDGAHRVSAIWLLQQRMDPKNPLWANAKLNVQFVKQSVAENFADGKKPGRKGLAKRSGVNTKASVNTLRNVAKHSTGEKQRMAHWLANMKAGRAKARKK